MAAAKHAPKAKTELTLAEWYTELDKQILKGWDLRLKKLDDLLHHLKENKDAEARKDLSELLVDLHSLDKSNEFNWARYEAIWGLLTNLQDLIQERRFDRQAAFNMGVRCQHIIKTRDE